MSVAPDVHGQSADRPTGLDYVHLRLAAGVESLELHSRYDVRVASPDGRYGRAQFSEGRGGVGPVLLGGVGFLFLRHFVAGARVEYARVHAPLEHDFLPEIGAEFEPWITVWGGGLFADLRFGARGCHAGGAFSYRSVAEARSDSEGQRYARGWYTPPRFVDLLRVANAGQRRHCRAEDHEPHGNRLHARN